MLPLVISLASLRLAPVSPTWVAPSPTYSRVVVAEAETLQVQRFGTRRANSSSIVIITGPLGSAYGVRKLTTPLAASGSHILVIDPLGMGASSRPAHADYTLGAQARRIAQVLDAQLGASAARVIVGQGTSATIALHLAADSDSGVIDGVVSLAGGVVNKQGTSGVKLALTLAPLLDTPLGRAIGRRRFASTARAQSADASWVTGDAVTAYLATADADVRGTLRALKAMSEAVETVPIEAKLARVHAPVRLLVGDKVLPNAPTAAQIATMRLGLADFRVDTLRPGGTMLHEEQAPAVVRAIESLMRRNSLSESQRISANLSESDHRQTSPRRESRSAVCQ